MGQYDREKIREMKNRLLPNLNIPLEETDTPFGIDPFPGYNEFLQEMMETVDETHKLYGPEKAESVADDYMYELVFRVDQCIRRDYAAAQRALEVTLQSIGVREMPQELKEICEEQRENYEKMITYSSQELDNLLRISLERSLKK